MKRTLRGGEREFRSLKRAYIKHFRVVLLRID